MPIRTLVTVVLALLLAGCPPPRGVYHTVRQGQTLYRISKVYGIDAQRMARLNGISDPTRLKVGQRLFVPGADRVRSVPSTGNPAPASRQAQHTESPQPASRPAPATGQSTVAPAGKQKAQPSPPAANRGQFAWPLRGKVVKGFAAKTGAPHKGVEIAAEQGTPVFSAAAGKVIFSGNGISGYGNLIILKHDDSFYTVYGFNQKNLVEEGAFVSKGERIALCGPPPDGGRARLHFEIRHGKKAVNPIFYLP